MSGFLGDQQQAQQKNLILAVLLALGAVLVYQSFVTPPPPPGAVTEGSGTTDGADALEAPVDVPRVAEGSGAPVVEEAAPVPALRLRGPNHDVAITNVGGRVEALTIFAPEQYIPHENITGIFPREEEEHYLLSLDIEGLPDLREDSVFALVEPATVQGADGTYDEVAMRWTSPDGAIQITRRFSPTDEAFGLNVSVEVQNLTQNDRRFGRLTTSMYGEFSPESGGLFNRSASMLEGLCVGDFGVESRQARKIEELRSYGAGDQHVSFGGLAEQYFLAALIPTGDTLIRNCSYAPVDGTHVVTHLDTPAFELPAGAAHTFEFVLYTGPKHVDYLRPFPEDLNRAIDLGMFSFLAIPIRSALLFFQGWVINWGLAIMLLTLAIKILLFPVTQKGYTSMEKMKRVQPKLAELQKKYENDKMKLAEEQMKLFKDEGVSPMSGCLPMLAQMPIYFALYRTIWGSAELYNAPFFGWITDLSQPDPYFILPLLMGAVMFIQQQLMPQAVDNPQMKMVNRIMPIMFTAMMLFLPSGLVLYIFVNMFLSIFQMLYIRKKFSTPDDAASAKR